MSYFDKIKAYVFADDKKPAVVKEDVIVTTGDDNDNDTAVDYMQDIFNSKEQDDAFNSIIVDVEKKDKEKKWKDIGFSGISFNDDGSEKAIVLDNPYGNTINYIKDIDTSEYDKDDLKELADKYDLDHNLVKALSLDENIIDNPERELKLLSKISNRVKKGNKIEKGRDVIVAYTAGPEYVFGDKVMSQKLKDKNNNKRNDNGGDLDRTLSAYVKMSKM